MPQLSLMQSPDLWGEDPPDQRPPADSQGPANPFKDKRLRDRFGRQLDQVYPAPQTAPPDEVSHLLRKIAVQLDSQA